MRVSTANRHDKTQTQIGATVGSFSVKHTPLGVCFGTRLEDTDVGGTTKWGFFGTCPEDTDVGGTKRGDSFCTCLEDTDGGGDDDLPGRVLRTTRVRHHDRVLPAWERRAVTDWQQYM